MKQTGLERMIKQNYERLCSLEEELTKIKGGALHVRQRGDRYYYWEYDGKQQMGITRNTPRIYQLARKRYLEKEIKTLRRRYDVLKAAQKDIERALKNDETGKVCEYYKMLNLERVVHTPKEQSWIKSQTSSNPYRRENLKYATSQGVMTRSKSERFIGNALEEQGLVYVTEPEILIDGKVYYPDFMILRNDGTTVIWEHCGLMDDSEYRYKALMKIDKYRSIGYVQTDNLIYTFEEDLEEMERLHEIIERFIGC